MLVARKFCGSQQVSSFAPQGLVNSTKSIKDVGYLQVKGWYCLGFEPFWTDGLYGVGWKSTRKVQAEV